MTISVERGVVAYALDEPQEFCPKCRTWRDSEEWPAVLEFKERPEGKLRPKEGSETEEVLVVFEWIGVRCGRCDHSWVEKPADWADEDQDSSS